MLTKTQIKILASLLATGGKPECRGYTEAPNGNGFIASNGYVLFRVENEPFPWDKNDGLKLKRNLYELSIASVDCLITHDLERQTVDLNDVWVKPTDKRTKIIPIAEGYGVNKKYLKWALDFYHGGTQIWIDHQATSVPMIVVLNKEMPDCHKGFAVIAPVRKLSDGWVPYKKGN